MGDREGSEEVEPPDLERDFFLVRVAMRLSCLVRTASISPFLSLAGQYLHFVKAVGGWVGGCGHGTDGGIHERERVFGMAMHKQHE